MRRTTGDHHHHAGSGYPPLPVADPVAGRDRVAVQHRRPDGQGPPIAEPQVGADPRPELHPWVVPAQRVDLRRTDMGHEPLLGRGLLEPALDLRQVTVAERQVQGVPLDPDALSGLHGGGHVGGREAVPPDRRERFEQHPWPVVAAADRGEIGQPPDGVQDAWSVDRVGEKRSPGFEHEDVAVEALLDLGNLGVRADGDGVDAQPLGPACQAADAEAVAVALGDRHQTGMVDNDPAQMVAPAGSVDVQGDRHQRRLM